VPSSIIFGYPPAAIERACVDLSRGLRSRASESPLVKGDSGDLLSGVPWKRNSSAKTRKAVHDYIIEETFEAGLILNGSEVKSLRDGQSKPHRQLPKIRREAYLYNLSHQSYPFAHHMKLDPDRPESFCFTKGRSNA